MSEYQVPSLGWKRYASSKRPLVGVDVELVTDDIVQLVFYCSVREGDVDFVGFQLAHAVDEVASFLDFYGFVSFRHFDLQFGGARAMLSAQKAKDRNKPPR